jgi:hypothetical protein
MATGGGVGESSIKTGSLIHDSSRMNSEQYWDAYSLRIIEEFDLPKSFKLKTWGDLDDKTKESVEKFRKSLMMATGGGVEDLKAGQNIQVVFEDHDLEVTAKIISIKGDDVKLKYFDNNYNKNITFTASKEYNYENGKIVIGDSYEIFSKYEKNGYRWSYL